MKKRLHLILFIIICFVLVGIFLYKQLIPTIHIKEYEIRELVSIDINNDGKKEKIQVTSGIVPNENKYISDKFLFSNLYSKTEININIDGNNYSFYTDGGERVHSLGIADLNLDNKVELLVCVYDDSISPSYRKWNIYKYDNKNLTFAENIYDGYITYNKLTNKLKVKYSLHQTVKPMTETVFYDIDF